MEITCPKCTSRFNLPDSIAKPGTRLRCSVCKEIFRLEESATASTSSHPERLDLDIKPKGSKGTTLLRLLLLILLICGGALGWWYYRHGVHLATEQAVPIEKKVELLTMRNVRQFYVNNEKVGQILVIEGKVVNEFPVPKELIQIEAALYGQDQQTLATKTQLAGTALSLFQLQVLGEKELESFLNNKIEILSNNTNVQPGSEVPFMVLFYKPPPNVGEFGVKIVDVKDTDKK